MKDNWIPAVGAALVWDGKCDLLCEYACGILNFVCSFDTRKCVSILMQLLHNILQVIFHFILQVKVVILINVKNNLDTSMSVNNQCEMSIVFFSGMLANHCNNLSTIFCFLNVLVVAAGLQKINVTWIVLY